jgi:hypothetical protein
MRPRVRGGIIESDIGTLAVGRRGILLVAEWIVADHTPPPFADSDAAATRLADACARAARITGDITWKTGVERAAGWFMGANDLGLTLYDPGTGGGFDGLRADGINVNQGAESTLAALSTMQQVHRVGRSPYSP